jgi:hypothetical protein
MLQHFLSPSSAPLLGPHHHPPPRPLDSLAGVKVSDKARLEARGLDVAVVARRATEAYLIQILKHGFFHAGEASRTQPRPRATAAGIPADDVLRAGGPAVFPQPSTRINEITTPLTARGSAAGFLIAI